MMFKFLLVLCSITFVELIDLSTSITKICLVGLRVGFVSMLLCLFHAVFLSLGVCLIFSDVLVLVCLNDLLNVVCFVDINVLVVVLFYLVCSSHKVPNPGWMQRLEVEGIPASMSEATPAKPSKTTTLNQKYAR